MRKLASCTNLPADCWRQPRHACEERTECTIPGGMALANNYGNGILEDSRGCLAGQEKSVENIRSEVRRIWNTNASYWDSRMNEGNAFHRVLLLPALERLLELKKGQRVLEVACGNGQLSRWMAGKGTSVVALDISDKLIEIAKSKGCPPGGSIEYITADASDENTFNQFVTARFDSVVCNMALMDMPEIEPLAKALPLVLKRGGAFVFSATHPCFNMSDMRRVASETEEGGVVTETCGIEIRHYLSQRTERGLAIAGQPEAQLYFERPLSLLLRPFLHNGLLINAFEEPSFPHPDKMEKTQPVKWFDWQNYPDIPPVIVVRLISS